MKHIIVLFLIFAALFASAGCGNLLEGDFESVSIHEIAPYVKPPVEQISVSDIDEFRDLLLQLIMEHESVTQIQYYNFDGEDVNTEIQRVCDEIMHEHPIGVYAVEKITAGATRIVSYFEVDIEIIFKRTREQLESIVNVSTQRYMMTQLLSIMGQHKEEAVIRTSMQLSDEEIAEQIKEIYYENPRRIVMLPFVTVEIFPEEGMDRIYEIKFGHAESPGMLQQYGENLSVSVRRNAENAVGDTDAEILLSLVGNLMASTEFDEGTARTISTHGAQNFAATAFGALVRGSAVGEGFAMAFKALCDELGFDCRVVLGLLDGRVHAWNIVLLEGAFYHIDVAMCVVNGLETAFLKTDEDFEEMYDWDKENTVRCEGELTLEDIIGTDEPEDPDNPDNPDNPGDPENPDNPDDPVETDGEPIDEEE